MATKVTNYVPSETTCNVLGLNLEGFDKDSFITVTPMSDRVTYREAPDGTVSAFVKRNQAYEVQIKLVRTSPSNAFMQLVFNLFLSYGQLFKLPVHIRGGGIASTFFATDSFLKTEPTSEHGSTLPVNTWTFICFNATYSELGDEADDSYISEIAGAVAQASEIMNILGIDPSGIVSKVSEISNRTGVTGAIQSTIGRFFD